mmetsp:Transcript_34294/g.103337  ORF Transcript_34294/g.103337 Transcript_34294/m.103337 type:complete len:248 (+) Transcript_34294:1826-2569(+)
MDLDFLVDGHDLGIADVRAVNTHAAGRGLGPHLAADACWWRVLVAGSKEKGCLAFQRHRGEQRGACGDVCRSPGWGIVPDAIQGELHAPDRHVHSHPNDDVLTQHTLASPPCRCPAPWHAEHAEAAAGRVCGHLARPGHSPLLSIATVPPRRVQAIDRPAVVIVPNALAVATLLLALERRGQQTNLRRAAALEERDLVVVTAAGLREAGEAHGDPLLGGVLRAAAEHLRLRVLDGRAAILALWRDGS